MPTSDFDRSSCQVQETLADLQDVTDHVPAIIEPMRMDSRWQRPLPWAVEWEYASQGIVSFLLLGCFFALTMVVLPAATMMLALKRRQFGLRTLLVMPLLVSIFFFASLVPVPSEHDFRSVTGRLMIGVSFAVPMFAIYQWLKLILTNRYWQAATWLVVALGCSLIFASIQLTASLSRSPLLPQESIDWAYWYMVFLIGGYVTTYVMAIAHFIGWLSHLPSVIASRSRPFAAMEGRQHASNQDERTAWLIKYEAWLKLLARQEIDSRFAGKFDSSDAVQQTLVAAWQGWEQFRGSTEAQRMAWLRQILAHQLANLARHYAGTQMRSVNREQSIDASLTQSAGKLNAMLPSQDVSPSVRAMENERSLQLARAIESLPDDYRQVIMLRNFQDLSHEEVATRMQRSEGAVRMIWVRALAALRDAMAHQQS